ncbi:hypothetical protein DRQ11_05305 [candidate division KSB1 bacterium]|nr:MAG: hypothetical protein DRQ11_05305 [candidate division KSB1 bacterium]
MKKIYEKAKIFFQIPRFKQYAINEGIHRLLFGKKFKTAPPKKSKFIQLPYLSFRKAFKNLGKVLIWKALRVGHFVSSQINKRLFN